MGLMGRSDTFSSEIKCLLSLCYSQHSTSTVTCFLLPSSFPIETPFLHKSIESTILKVKPMANFFSLFSFPTLFSLLVAVTIHTEAQEGKATVQQQQLWCVAKNNAQDTALQQALDWACGPGGADCGPIQNGGPCYDPNDLIDMASYAFNDYCLKHGMTDETCNFSNTAALTALDPSHDKCKYASSIFSTPNSTTPSTAGIIPGSEDLNVCAHFSTAQIATLAFINLLLAVFTIIL